VLSILARRLPTQFLVVAALIAAFLLFNCVYALIVNQRQITSRVSNQLTTPRALNPRQQQQQKSKTSGGEETRPLLTATTPQQQPPKPQQP